MGRLPEGAARVRRIREDRLTALVLSAGGPEAGVVLETLAARLAGANPGAAAQFSSMGG